MQNAGNPQVADTENLAPRAPVIKAFRVFKGANLYIQRPAVLISIDLCDLSDKQLGRHQHDGLAFLLGLIPDLGAAVNAVQPASAGAPGNWLHSASMIELMAFTMLALLNRVEQSVTEIRTGQFGTDSRYYIACEYKHSPENAKEAATLAIELIGSAFAQQAPDTSRFKRRLAEFQRNGDRRGPPINTALILKEAETRRIPVNNRIAGPTRLGHGRFQQRLRETMTTGTGHLAVRMTSDKDETLDILKAAGIPVPEHRIVRSPEQAVRAAEAIGFPVVVKPISGNMGKGVSVGLSTSEDVVSAYAEALKVDSPVIVEQFIPGSDHRLLVIDGELVAVCQRVPGHVVGNGLESVGRLLEKLNADPIRNGGLFKKIEVDFDAKRMLAEQVMDFDSIPQLGEVVYLRSRANTSAGGTSIGVTELVHPDNRRMAIAAARALELNVAGIDLLITDISRSYKENGGAICEVNSRPGIVDLHISPLKGSRVNVVPYIIEMLFPGGMDGRILTVAVCGQLHKARIAHATTHLLQMLGHEVGLATHEGLWIAGDLVLEKNLANSEGAESILWNPIVDAAVLETSTHSIIEEGLGFDLADVVVVTDWPDADNNEESTRLAALATAIRAAKAVVFPAITKPPDVLLKAAAGRRTFGILSGIEDLSSLFDVTLRLNASASAVLVETNDNSELIELPSALHHSQQVTTILAAVAVCCASGFAASIIEDRLKFLPSKRIADHLFMGGLDTALGPVLLATPRNSDDVTAICAIARSWAAPRTPDVFVQMSFTGDPGIQAALASELETGFGVRFELDNSVSLPRQLEQLPIKSKDPASKLLILTDNMEFFRKILPLQPLR